MAENDRSTATEHVATAEEMLDEVGLSVERIGSFLTLLSMITTHDIVPDDEKQSAVLSLEYAMRCEIDSIATQGDGLRQAGRSKGPRGVDA